MERASEAMKQIHGKLTPEKVDETMYVHRAIIYRYRIFLKRFITGRNYTSKMLSARRLWRL